MLPAFRVKGVWPKPAGFRQADGIVHPVTGAQLPKYQNTEAILQLPRSKYDELISGHPEYRLKYLDEDKEEITIGSEIELTQRLQEPTSHSRFVTRTEHPRFYIAIPECMHAFHIADNEETRKIWQFFGSSTMTRNRPAYRLWTTPSAYCREDLMDLLTKHAYEFMTGYDFEGFNSHYNYLSETGRSIKDLASKEFSFPTGEENVSTSGSSDGAADVEISMDKKVKIPRDLDSSASIFSQSKSEPSSTNPPGITPSKSDIAILTNTDILKSTDNSLWNLSKIQSQYNISPQDLQNLMQQRMQQLMVLTGENEVKKIKTGDKVIPNSQSVTPSDQQQSTNLNEQLDKHLHIAQSATNLLHKMASTGNSTSGYRFTHGNHSPQPVVPPIDPSVVHEQYRARGTGSAFAKELAAAVNFTEEKDNIKSVRPLSIEVQPAQKPFQPSDFLTKIGKEASRAAGTKLRDQLHGLPKPHHGATTNDVHRWVAYSRDPPEISKGESIAAKPVFGQANADISSLNRKKSVRFAPTAAVDNPRDDITVQQLLNMEEGRGDFARDRTLSKHSKAGSGQTVVSESTTDAATKSTNDCLPLTSSELAQVRQMLAAWETRKDIPIAVLTKPSADETNSGSTKTETQPKEQPSEKHKSHAGGTPQRESPKETPETTVTKMWCQALEGIISNIRVFADQLEHHVQPQIDKEQTALDSKLRDQNGGQSPETDQTFFHGVKAVKDLIGLRDNVQQITNNLRGWTETTQKRLDEPQTISGNEINIKSIQSTFESINRLREHVEQPMASIYQNFIPVSDSKGKSRQNLLSAIREHSSSKLYVPRRLAIVPQIPDQTRQVNLKESIRQTDSSAEMSMRPLSSDVGYSSRTHVPPYVYAQLHHASHNGSDSANPASQLYGKFPSLVPTQRMSMMKPSFTPSVYPANQLNKISTSSTQLGQKVTSRDSIHHSETEPLLPSIETELPSVSVDVRRISSYDKETEVQVQPQNKIAATDRLRKTASLPAIRYPSLSQPSAGRSAVPSHDRNVTNEQTGFLETMNTPSPQFHNSEVGHGVVRRSKTVNERSSVTNRHSNPILPRIALTDDSRAGMTTGPTLRRAQSARDTLRRSTNAHARPWEELPASTPISSELFELWEDIPEHADLKTADKIAKCVHKLKSMGYGQGRSTSRLVVYAQAAKGDITSALDIIEEEEKAFKQHRRHSTNLI